MSSSASYIQCKATFALVSISLLIAASCPFQTEGKYFIASAHYKSLLYRPLYEFAASGGKLGP